LLAGDEIGQTQGGNNNAYCQDNAISWLNWTNQDARLTRFVADLIHLRHAHAALRHARWFTGEQSDIVWLRPDGGVMAGTDWDDRQVRSFACQIEVAEAGVSPSLRWLLMFNPSDQALHFALPPGHWIGVLDSSAAIAMPQKNWASAQSFRADISISPRSMVGLVQKLQSTV
jgi:glycogen operon protein